MESTTANQHHGSSSTKENRLAKEKSPYLLQHKHNPVDWYAWGEEAFEKARKEDKPIFLSVGYSTCHWCHVMAHESFESEEIAKLMNELFVNIKVDREERPDIDKIYMTYVQAVSGGGGWPMSVWLTPDLKPLVGGTYFPPKDQYGRPGFSKICQIIAKKWKENKSELTDQGDRIMAALQEATQEKVESGSVDKSIITKCYIQILRGFDEDLGGFSDAPKFPRPVIFNLLFHVYNSEGPDSEEGHNALAMAMFTLQKMGEGGMFDHLGGGFHRYSVTPDWHVPHFEKMLYDQAQLVVSYLDAFQISKEPFFERRARDVMDYVRSTLTSKEGGIFSAEDADSLLEHGKPEHAEGAFYVWSYEEIGSLLGADQAEIFNYHYGVKKEGNSPPGGDPHGEFKGKNILIQRHSVADTAKHFKLKTEECEEKLSKMRKILFDVREKRPRPHLDDKIITSWNGLMISAFARGYQVLGDRKYLESAESAASFIESQLYSKTNGTLIRNYREGPSNIEGFGDDYAFLITGLLDLYEASLNVKWLDWAVRLQEKQNELFWDATNGGYFSVKEGSKDVLLRMKEEYDGAEPSNNSYAALNLLRLSQMVGNDKYREYADKTIRSFSKHLKDAPIVMPHMCVAVDFSLAKPTQIVVAAKSAMDEDTRSLLTEIHSHFIPNKVILMADGAEGQEYLAKKLEFIKDMKPIGGKATVYVCENFTCNLPVNNVPDLAGNLAKHKSSHPAKF